jgi:RNA ligase (TIGR02306 family)
MAVRSVVTTMDEGDLPCALERLSTEDGPSADPDEEGNLTRVLARMVRLGSVRAHPDPEVLRLNVAKVAEWDVIVGKTETEGMLGVFLEIDSVLPRMRAWPGECGLPDSLKRIQTRNFRGVLSQGLFIDAAKLSLLASSAEGDDVTQLLGVTKYEPYRRSPAGRQRAPRGPSQFETYGQVIGDDGPPKTDEPRAQNCFGRMATAMRGKAYDIVVKYDGSSMTAFFRDGEVVFLSRNIRAQPGTPLHADFLSVANEHKLHDVLSRNPAYVVQAEVYSAGINGNHMGLVGESPRMAVFNVWDRERRGYLGQEEMRGWCVGARLPYARFVEIGSSFDYTFSDLLKIAEGSYREDGVDAKGRPVTYPREGIVVRPIEPMYIGEDGKKERVSFKVINNQFLLRYGL